MPIGLSFPFALATGSLGYLEVTNDVAAAIESNVRCLILTNWGERVMHYDFGFNLREFIFEPKTEQLRARVADRANAQLSKWMPFLNLRSLKIAFSGEDSSIPDNGVLLSFEFAYGNIPIKFFQLFPGT